MRLIPEGSERKRIVRIMNTAISDLALDLRGIGVLTEAASHYFAVTPLIAALAGASPVIAVGRDSHFGRGAEIFSEIRRWARELGIDDCIMYQEGPPVLDNLQIDLVTNLGFVRPINESLLNGLSDSAVVSLMWEPWELRADELDLEACRRLGVPVLATCETHPRLKTYEYLAMVAARLLLEKGVEVFRSRLVVVGSDPFGSAIVQGLKAMAATEVMRIEPGRGSVRLAYGSRSKPADAIIFAEHRDPGAVIGGPDGIDPGQLVRDGTVVVHICGHVDADSVRNAGLVIYPSPPAKFGRMTVTTAYVGATPVVDLHAAGLKVGELGVRNRRAGGRLTDLTTQGSVRGLVIPVQG